MGVSLFVIRTNLHVTQIADTCNNVQVSTA